MYSINKKPDAVLVDYRLPNKMKMKIERLGIETVDTVPNPNLYEAVKGHPDLMGCPLNDITIIDPFLYKEKYKEIENFSVIVGNSTLEKGYPNHIKYNVATFGKFAVGFFEYVDTKIIDLLNDKNIQQINTRQGYSKCSTMILDEKNLITSDISIFKAIEKISGINIALVNKGDIKLHGLDYGFIGGACSLLDKKTLAFMGSLDYYVNGKRILDILNSLQIDVIFLSNTKLCDYGSFVPLYKK